MEEIIFEDGDHIRRLKGTIIKDDEHFITIDAGFKIFRINKKIILKIEETKP